MPASSFWISLVTAVAVLNWVSADRGWRKIIYVTKPSVMLLLLLLLFRTGEVPGRLTWFFAGAALGLAGDIFLMLPGKRTFFYGLLAFLAGHIAYTIALQPNPFINPLISLLVACGLGIAASLLARRFSLRMQRSGLSRLRLPVLVYILVIVIMAWSAWLTLLDPHWPLPASLLVSAGALLFLLSDGLLARDRFIRPQPHARLQVIVTYHLAQAAILAGAILSLKG